MPKIGNSMKNTDAHLKDLVRLALDSGASKAAVISTDQIAAEEHLAELCRKPKCKNFGLSLSCPPLVSGPSGFREFLKDKNHAIVLRIDLPSSVLFSDQRREIIHLLHELVSDIEKKAVNMGFRNSKSFAGSSCKQIFCRDHEKCGALSEHEECRYPETARPSMSGFGINVSRLMTAAGWSSKMNARNAGGDEDSMSWVAGLIVIG